MLLTFVWLMLQRLASRAWVHPARLRSSFSAAARSDLERPRACGSKVKVLHVLLEGNRLVDRDPLEFEER